MPSFTFLASLQDTERIGKQDLAILGQVYQSYFPASEVSVELELVSLEVIQTINTEQRNIVEPTDVLSFPTFSSLLEAQAYPSHELLLGSIVISPDKATLYNESLSQLVHHGLLHLLGFDHETDLAGWIGEEGRIVAMLEAAGIHVPSLLGT